MRKSYLKIKNALITTGAMILCGAGANAQTVTTYSFTGNVQTFTVPSCVTVMTVDIRGAEGAVSPLSANNGGRGGRVVAEYNVTAGQVFYIYVGGANGYNGGGTGNGQYGGVGGGASDIRINGTALANRELVAGGGGGGGLNCSLQNEGGHGGGLIGEDGWQCGQQNSYVGTGGTQSAGGTNQGGLGFNGSLGMGGNGSSTYGGGGGGGYYGGGGASYGGGGGGSNYVGTNSVSVVHTRGFQTGNGLVILSYNMNGAGVSLASNPVAMCEASSATLTAGSVLSYTWNNGSNNSSLVVSPNTTTTYTVSGTNNLGCVSSAIVTVQVNPLPQMAIAVSPSVLCVGNTATLSANGAASYMWNPGGSGSSVLVNPSSTTVYTLTGTSAAGCSKDEVVTVPVNTNSLTVTPATSVCLGESLQMTASGANTYTWSTGSFFNISNITPTSSAVYTVSGTDVHDCVISNVVSVAVNNLPNVSASSDKMNICKGESVNLSATGATTYTWNTGDVGAAQTYMLPVDVAYTYFVTGTDANGCSKTAAVTVNVNRCTGIAEQTNGVSQVSVYPNPGTGLFTVEAAGNNVNVYDIYGKLVLSNVISTDKTVVDLSNQAAGVYFVHVTDNKGTSVSKIVKQ